MHSTASTPLPSLWTLALAVLVLGVRSARGEKHTITFDNRCGRGTPQLIQQGNILSSGGAFTSNGPFVSGIAYLQTGNCLLNGEGCSLVEMTLVNPTCPGCGSSTDISLIPPHAFSVPVSFSYSGGCTGQGATCTSPTCKTAFFVPDDNQVQVECQDADVDLVITFCPGSASPAGGGGDSGNAASSIQAAAGGTTRTLQSSATAKSGSSSSATASASAATSTSIASEAKPVQTVIPDSEPPRCAKGARRRRSVSGVDSEVSGVRRGHWHGQARRSRARHV